MMVVEERHIEASLPTIFVIFTGVLFAHLGRLGDSGYIKQEKQKNLELTLQEEKSKIFKTLAGTIAHELRNPLNTINLIGTQINDLAIDMDKQSESYQVKYNSESPIVPSISVIPTVKSKLLNLTSHITDSISSANNIINIILGDLSEKKIDPEDFFYLEPNKILSEILEKYCYKSDEEKAKVKLIPFCKENDFLIKAVPDHLTYIVFNLLKNALYYLNQYPDSIVTVGTETSNSSLRTKGKAIQKSDEITGLPRHCSPRNDGGNIDYNKYNVIYVHDTGPGIPSNIIPKLFGDFYTSGKKEGTGLGLSFCKRNMRLFGGDIICESEFAQGKNGWTKFSLLFPKLSEEEIKEVKTEVKRKKILIVDDQEINLITTKSKIEKILFYISCDIVRSGKEAIDMMKQNKYSLILMDVQIPELNGAETTRKIRKFNKDIPIIAYTSLKYTQCPINRENNC